MNFRHLIEINEDYLSHFKFAGYCGIRMLGASLAIFIHAMLPCLFETTASDTMLGLLNDINRRKELAKATSLKTIE